MLENHKLDRKVALKISVKAMNDTMGPKGLVPSYLIFGWILRFPAVDSTLQDQATRMDALSAARRKMVTISADQRIRTALASRVPRNADLKIGVGDKVRAFRETDKRFTGPFPVIRVDSEQIFVLNGDREV